MTRPPKLCVRCNVIVPVGELCACQRATKRARNRRHDQNRPSAAKRGYNHRWRVASKAFLKRFPQCARCFGRATLVDHIIPHKGDNKLFWDRSNWQPLCKPCHDRHKQREERQ